MSKQDKIAARRRAKETYPHADDVLNRKKLSQHLNNNTVKQVPHPQGTLRLFDYTSLAERRHKWDGVTTTCRGLLVDNKQMVVARPLPKFFSHTEKKSAAVPAFRWNDMWETQEKVDGTMIIVSNYNGTRVVTTRGSFDDWRIPRAETLLGSFMPEMAETVVFEYVGPDNQIVVPYSEEALVCLAVVDNWTGADDPVRRLEIEQTHEYRPLTIHGEGTFETPEELFATDPGDGTSEGYVLVVYRKGKPSVRLKVKHESWLTVVRERLRGYENKNNEQ